VHGDFDEGAAFTCVSLRRTPLAAAGPAHASAPETWCRADCGGRRRVLRCRRPDAPSLPSSAWPSRALCPSAASCGPRSAPVRMRRQIRRWSLAKNAALEPRQGTEEIKQDRPECCASDEQKSGCGLNGRPLAGELCGLHHGQVPRQKGGVNHETSWPGVGPTQQANQSGHDSPLLPGHQLSL
jgi:hypothetical protein